MENKKYCGTHIAQTPANATHFLKAEVLEDGSIVSMLLPSDPYRMTPLSRELEPLKRDLDDWLDAPIGRLNMPLWPGDKLDMAMHGAPIANFFNQVQLDASKADISCTSLPNDMRGFDSKVTVRDVVATYVYANTLVVMKVSGKELKEALERCASYFDVSPRGEVSIAKDFLEPKVAHYNYDFFAGINYSFDLSKPCGQRVVKITRNGALVKEDQQFTLCMNNYRATGSGGYDVYLQCLRLREINTEVSELLLDYLTKYKLVNVCSASPLTVLPPENCEKNI
jgi:2',3'-cyclic-nucleotide 2'-phosphodiesterase/3'-nucleotidase